MSRMLASERFYQVGGAMRANTPSYVQRQADQELLVHAAAGDFCYVLTPRQMGKSSLIAHTVAQLKKKRLRSVVIDLQGKTERGMTAEAFYAGLLAACIDQLKLPVALTPWWQERVLLSAVQRFADFLTDEVLPRVPKRLVVFIDEIDTTLSLDFSDDFFAALRALYNARARNPAYKRLTCVLVGVASPSDLVKDRTRSPFNIGHRVELTDFTVDEARKFTEGFPVGGETAERLLQRVLFWTGGHPYLTHKVCAALAADGQLHQGSQRVDQLVERLFFADATWSDPNLATVRDRVVQDKDNPDILLELYRHILSGEQVLDDERSPVHARLKLSGIVKVIPGGMLRPSNHIYECVFDTRWVDTVLHARAGEQVSQTATPTPAVIQATVPQPRVVTIGQATETDLAQPIQATMSQPRVTRQPPGRLDLATWKAQVAERLQGWRPRLEPLGVDSVYACLAALTLQPVLQAARTGEWAALMTLGSVVARVGSDWLATHLQDWQDETDAARHIAAHVATEPALKAELDTVLETLEVFPQARQALPEADRQWFVETLRAELARQGHLSRFVAQLSGSGAMALGTGAVAAGQGGVAIGGDVYGNIYTGPPPRDSAAALLIYRRVLRESSRHLSLRGLDLGASDPTGTPQRFDLTQVYVDLLTTTQVPQDKSTRGGRQRPGLAAEHETRPLGALEAVTRHRCLVLLGDPGAGKSTCLTHLALCLAAHALEPGQEWLARLPQWPRREADVVPVPVVLRDFASWLPAGAKQAQPSHLWRFIATRLEAQNLRFVAEPLHDTLEAGRAIVLLDGLDEIPTSQQRTFIRDAVTTFAERYPQCRVVVTCRTLSYQDPAWQLPDFAQVTLASFNEAQIDRFIAAWYAELARLGSIKPGAVEGVTRHLQAAIRRPDLWRLAPNPLLLTVMALVHTHKGRLPEARALLYEETVDLLLWRWEQVKVSGEDDTPRLRQLLAQAERTDVDLKGALWRLAFEAHQQGGATDGEAVADIAESQLSRTLTALHPDKSRDWAHQVIEVMKLRAGLLLERAPEVYTFPHRTFQEYLAGAHLSAAPDFAQQAARLAAAGAFWRDVILLAVGRLVYLNGDTARPLALVAELCPAQPTDTDNAWRQAWLAGDVLLEMGRNRARDTNLGRELDERVRQRLVGLVRAGRLSPVERAAAGNTLGHLDDPRFREDAWYLPDEPLLGFVEIPAGLFRMGSTKREPLAFDNQRPRHTLTLPRYYIARYPVTVAQFQAFVDAKEYPWKYQDGQGALNHPVVEVSWYDALAYCDWLTERLRECDGTPEPLKTLLRDEGWRVALPSEAEWEKAARGIDGRQYPWGDKPDSNRANYDDTGIGTTSAVGCFPGGASPYGVEELSGNVWEWTRSLWGTDFYKLTFVYPYRPDDGREDLNASENMHRVLRGGAFWRLRRDVRCAVRARGVPRGVGYRGVGCRVVVAGLP